MPDDPKTAYGSDFIWRAPLISWLAEQPGFVPDDPEVRRILDELTDDVPANVGAALWTIQFHAELDLLDDLRQWWLEGDGRSRVVPLWMQHCGARTSVLDLTSDLDMALYFAHRTWSDDQQTFSDVSTETDPLILVFAERSVGSGDQFIIDTADLLRTAVHVNPPSRIAGQRCGLLRGANAYARNLAHDLAIALVDLSDFAFEPVPGDAAVYPPPSNDTFFDRLLRTKPEPPGLRRYGY